jgi:RHS repeat-associated protein
MRRKTFSVRHYVKGHCSFSYAVDQLFYYTGQEWDADAQLYNYNARWYDPNSGRFLSEDPLGAVYPPRRDADDPNLYRYVGNSPVR